jgi:AhpD family alkylhydroperoxidase
MTRLRLSLTFAVGKGRILGRILRNHRSIPKSARTAVHRQANTTTKLENEMSRIVYKEAAPAVYQAMLGLERCVSQSGLERSLLELVRTRASQLNGCAFCLDMHSRDAIAAGETTQRLIGLSAWRDAPFYTERERAALAWTERVTQLGPDGISDDDYDSARTMFDERELVNLTMAVIAINGWNRLAIAFHSPEAGSHVAATSPKSR